MRRDESNPGPRGERGHHEERGRRGTERARGWDFHVAAVCIPASLKCDLDESVILLRSSELQAAPTIKDEHLVETQIMTSFGGVELFLNTNLNAITMNLPRRQEAAKKNCTKIYKTMYF